MANCGPSRGIDELELLKRSAAGDEAARDALVERFLPLARSVARRYEGSGEPFEDVLQVACIGLLHAIDRFDPTRGAGFVSFAVPTMLGEIKRHFRDRTWAVHVPRGLNELSLRIDRFLRTYTAQTGIAPTIADIAAEVGAAHEQVLEALDVRRARRLASLDAPLRRTGDGTQRIGDTIESSRAQNDSEEADARVMLEPLLATLGTREQLILRLRFERDMTQAEIGAIIGVSQMQISRLLRRSIAHLNVIATPKTTA